MLSERFLQALNDAHLSSQVEVRDLNQSSDGPTGMAMPVQVRFWLLLVFEIPALGLTIFLLYHLLLDRALRSALHNHVVIVFLFWALITELIDVIAYLVFASIGHVRPAIPSFCRLWWFINIGVFLTASMLMAYASVERHVLIFHNKLISTRNRRILFHYMPIAGVLLYGFAYYISIIFFPTCEQTFDYTQPFCSYPCYFDDPVISIFDALANSVSPSILTSIFSVALIVRVIYQKIRMGQPVQWRKQRKMTIQLLSMVVLYITINLPVPMMIIAHLLGLDTDATMQVRMHADFLCYWIPLLLPYVCLGSLPEIQKKMNFLHLGWQRIQPNRTRTVAPSTQQTMRT